MVDRLHDGALGRRRVCRHGITGQRFDLCRGETCLRCRAHMVCPLVVRASASGVAQDRRLAEVVRKQALEPQPLTEFTDSSCDLRVVEHGDVDGGELRSAVCVGAHGRHSLHFSAVFVVHV